MTWDLAFGNGVDPADATAPAVASIVPPEFGPIGPTDTVTFDVTDAEGVVSLALFVLNDAPAAVAYAGGFAFPFSGTIDTSNANAWGVSLDNGDGWEPTAQVVVVATDTSGNVLIRTIAYGASVGVLNPSFEIAGASPGLAASWSVTVVSSVLELATFATSGSTEAAFESFEGAWSSNESFLFAFGGGDVDAALFDDGTVSGTPVERFEKRWDSNEFYVYESLLEQASFDSATQGFEDFEEGWDANESFLFAFGGGDVSAGVFGASAFESFEAGWDSNDTLYLLAFSGGNLSAATYDTTPEAFEDFEEEWSLVMTTV